MIMGRHAPVSVAFRVPAHCTMKSCVGPRHLSPLGIIDALINPPDPLHPPRPPLEALNCPDYVVQCLRECWDENPDQRPDFHFVNVRLREMQAGL